MRGHRGGKWKTKSIIVIGQFVWVNIRLCVDVDIMVDWKCSTFGSRKSGSNLKRNRRKHLVSYCQWNLFWQRLSLLYNYLWTFNNLLLNLLLRRTNIAIYTICDGAWLMNESSLLSSCRRLTLCVCVCVVCRYCLSLLLCYTNSKWMIKWSPKMGALFL